MQVRGITMTEKLITGKKDITRIKTYIDGYDENLEGGIPAGHVVLVSGTAGTMKSSMVFNIFFNEVLENSRHAVYVTLEQTRKSLEAQMASMGFDVEAVRGSVHLLDVGSIPKGVALGSTGAGAPQTAYVLNSLGNTVSVGARLDRHDRSPGAENDEHRCGRPEPRGLPGQRDDPQQDAHEAECDDEMHHLGVQRSDVRHGGNSR